MISNEISDIKVANFELTKEQKERIAQLEKQIKIISGKLYTLYN
jgi:hypothetical protein